MLPSAILQSLHDAVPQKGASLAWAMGRLEGQSFGLVLLLLAVIAAVPGVCSFAGLLIVMCAAQMAIGRPTPRFPSWIADRPLPHRQLRAIVPRLVAVMRLAERAVHPRWRKPGWMTGRLVGVVILLLGLRVVLMPVPLSNIPPAAAMAVISLAYFEEDGVVLLLGLVAGLAMIGLDAAVLADAIRDRWAS